MRTQLLIECSIWFAAFICHSHTLSELLAFEVCIVGAIFDR